MWDVGVVETEWDSIDKGDKEKGSEIDGIPYVG
jgi:hypothetical protein